MNTVKLLPVSEIARRGKKCRHTLTRRLAALHVEPDAIMVQGSMRVPLYVEPRVRPILELLAHPPVIQ